MNCTPEKWCLEQLKAPGPKMMRLEDWLSVLVPYQGIEVMGRIEKLSLLRDLR